MAKVSGREDTGLSVGPNGRIDYDEVLKHVGQMGKFQTRVFLLLCLVSALSGLAVFAFGFTGILWCELSTHLQLLGYKFS